MVTNTVFGPSYFEVRRLLFGTRTVSFLAWSVSSYIFSIPFCARIFLQLCNHVIPSHRPSTVEIFWIRRCTVRFSSYIVILPPSESFPPFRYYFFHPCHFESARNKCGLDLSRVSRRCTMHLLHSRVQRRQRTCVYNWIMLRIEMDKNIVGCHSSAASTTWVIEYSDKVTDDLFKQMCPDAAFLVYSLPKHSDGCESVSIKVRRAGRFQSSSVFFLRRTVYRWPLWIDIFTNLSFITNILKRTESRIAVCTFYNGYLSISRRKFPRGIQLNKL